MLYVYFVQSIVDMNRFFFCLFASQQSRQQPATTCALRMRNKFLSQYSIFRYMHNSFRYTQQHNTIDTCLVYKGIPVPCAFSAQWCITHCLTLCMFRLSPHCTICTQKKDQLSFGLRYMCALAKKNSHCPASICNGCLCVCLCVCVECSKQWQREAQVDVLREMPPAEPYRCRYIELCG